MQDTTIILAMDTSLGPCSVALLRDGVILAEAHEASSGQQSRLLVPMIESVFAKAGAGYQDCTAIASTLGPGGFTGIRTGLSTARAIALAAAKPLIGISSLEVIAYSTTAVGDFVVAVDAYRGEWYVQRFRKSGGLAEVSPPLLADEKGLKALAHSARIIRSAPDALMLAQLAYEKWSKGERSFSNVPLYLRAPDAKLPAANSLQPKESL